MTKGIKFLGKNEEGKDNIEYYDVEETPIEPIAYTPEQYNSRVAELIAEKYSFADEGAFLANYARVTSGIEINIIKTQQYIDEFFAFQEFRVRCKIQAHKDCGIE